MKSKKPINITGNNLIRILLILLAIAFGKSFPLYSQSTIDSKPGMKQTNDKILITYASESGSTAEIAKFIGNILAEDQTVEVLKISEVTDLSQYSHIIIGSPIMYDMWMSEARDFVKDNEDILARKNVSYFLVCLVLCGNDEKSERKANEYAYEIEKIAPGIKVKSFGKFAGVLNYSKMPFKSKVVMKTLMFFMGVKEGDYRDWEKIKEWTKEYKNNDY